jgi:peptidoglycan/xylan/chitin deacetylase (PgdA/CDA1 family)
MRASLRERAVRVMERTPAPAGLQRWVHGAGSIFVLHKIAAAGSRPLDPDMSVTADFLDAALSEVWNAGCEPIRIDEVAARLSRDPGARFACFTLDDGYRDTLTRALPVFRRRRIPFCLYVTTGLIDRSIDAWWCSLERLVSRCVRLDLAVLGVSDRLDCAAPAAKRAALAGLQAWVHEDLENRAPLIRSLAHAHGVDADEALDADALTWDELRTLAADPLVSIGVHTVSHPRLRLLTEDQARHELRASRRRIELELGRPAAHAAYPYGGPGACGAREFGLAREEGFETAVTTRRGNVFPVHRDYLTSLPRQRLVEGQPSLTHVRRCLSGLQWIMRGGPRVVTR